jgi:hypothetical protein
MTLRPLLILLVLANLAFAAWALLIDRPVGPPVAHDISRLPKLVLATEPLPGAATNAAASSGPASTAAPARHCVTVGPFDDLNTAASAAALLQSRGFTPTQRDEPGGDLVAYWVYLDNIASDAAATRLLNQLRAGGLSDARVMPATTPTDPRRISVGLFNEHAGAERRSRLVKNLGLTPVIAEQHQPQATYWVNIALASPDQSVSTEGLLPSGTAGAHLEIRDCPVPASSAPALSSAPKS